MRQQIKVKRIFEMRYDSCNQIADFIFKSVHHFYSLDLRNEEIKILMPESVKFVFQQNHMRVLYPDSEHEFLFKKFYDIEVQPHYKNEIVVYCPQFWKNPILDCPKILEIELIN